MITQLHRYHRGMSAWLCLAAMLFAQSAYAMQACMAVKAVVDEMPCHQQEQQPVNKNLCQNHCLAEQQTLDVNKVPAVFSMDEAVLVVPVVYVLSIESTRWSYSRAQARGGSPPLSILNCCFRI